MLLGASNLRRGLVFAVEEARRRLGPRVEILAALGNGRSYAQPSTFIARTMPGILDSGLWPALAATPVATPVRVLLTDVGNDLAYGTSCEVVAGWVEECLERLPVHSNITLTLLPMSSLRRLSERRFKLFRNLFFPGRPLALGHLLKQAERLCERLQKLSQDTRVSVIEPSGNWYDLDPIHIRNLSQAAAWHALLSPWGSENADPDWDPRLPAVDRLRLAWARPEEASLFGFSFGTQQPALCLHDGTVIGLY